MRAQIENGIQRSIVAYLRTVVRDCVVMAIPNAARRTINGKPMNAAPGLLPGAPDLVIALPDGKVLWLEVKAPKGVVSDNQVLVHERLGEIGHTVYIIRSIDDVKEVIQKLNITTREKQ